MSDPVPFPPFVTVAVPTYNRAEALRQTLADLANQDYPGERFEVLVVDNNSRDHTRDVVESFAAARPAPRWILETRQGLSHGRNRAIAEMRGDILVLADDDIRIGPGWIRELVAPLAADPSRRIGAVGGEVVPVFPEGRPDWIAEWHAPLAFRPDAGPLRPDQNPMGASLALPRWVFAAHGNFSTSLGRQGGRFFGGEETEFLRRLRAAGAEIWFAPAAKTMHQMPASRTTFRYAARHAFDSARSRVVARVTERRQAGESAAAYLGSRLAANAGKVIGLGLLALLSLVLLRTDDAKKALVRAWRSCGYLVQIARSALGLT
jgi:glycosyltransferase involved in cell wall biosynthesis